MIVVIVALESELSKRPLPGGVGLVHSGVGKVNAALATARILLTKMPTLVINFGTAGRVRPGPEGLVEIASVVQRDMLAIPLAERGTTPFDTDPPVINSGRRGFVCGTGDSFVTRPDAWLSERVDVVDMELYAIAHACRRHGVRWRAFKFITDAADERAADDWSDRVAHGESLFMELMATLS